MRSGEYELGRNSRRNIKKYIKNDGVEAKKKRNSLVIKFYYISYFVFEIVHDYYNLIFDSQASG